MRRGLVWLVTASVVALGTGGCSDKKSALGTDIPITSEYFPDEYFQEYLCKDV